MRLALPIHYLVVTLEFVGYILYRLLFYVVRDRARSNVRVLNPSKSTGLNLEVYNLKTIWESGGINAG